MKRAERDANLDDHHDNITDDLWRSAKARLVAASGVLLVAAYLAGLLVPSLGTLPFVGATLVALVPMARRAIAAARAGVIFTIEMLMTIAAVGAIAIGAAEEAAVVVFLFAIGEMLEGIAAARARRSISALSALTPKTAWVVEGGVVTEVAAIDLRPGQIVIVRPGDRVPCDGRILDGQSSIDESPVNGESVPRPKGVSDDVFAGTVNIEAALQVEVTKAAADNTIARIVRLVERAKEAKAPVERFIDRFARVYMPVVVLIATVVAIAPPLIAGAPWSVWTYRALALLLIACPCALVISTPVTVVSGLAAAGRHVDRAQTLFSVMTSSLNTRDVQAVDREWSPKFAAANDAIIFVAKLFARLSAIHAARDTSGLTAEQQRLFEVTYDRFVRAGAKLDAAQKAEMGRINKELAVLFTDFRQQGPRRREQLGHAGEQGGSRRSARVARRLVQGGGRRAEAARQVARGEHALERGSVPGVVVAPRSAREGVEGGQEPRRQRRRQ